jgi:hypothetical protein
MTDELHGRATLPRRRYLGEQDERYGATDAPPGARLLVTPNVLPASLLRCVTAGKLRLANGADLRLMTSGLACAQSHKD